jgi:hypothetical protein
MDTFHNILEHERQSAGAEYALRSLEQKCFVGVPPVCALEIVDDLRFPSTCIPEMRVIEISSSIAKFPKVARFLILHAMIHHKLAMQDPSYGDAPYGESFNQENHELVKRGAYERLL